MSLHPMVLSAKKMIREAFEGPVIPVKETAFTNREASSGIFGVLENLSPEKASQDVNGTTAAAHIDHIRYYIWGTNELLKTNKLPEMNWEQSWRIDSVDEAQWNKIKAELHKEYDFLMGEVEKIKSIDVHTNEVLGSLAHSAYHLGAVKQMLKALEK
ncbi:hypothetical protein [Jeotgalibacillus proteolyticus]|uniref:DinB-like domain-containing protein n=1 Tax=Jeotgalibacillus proteolyticus TaxID=2082395 RepID=A0A2S5G7U6_9BACL|nr:hypothetical protein [Jeotgalibacillus proteolyticus]PPA69025.1 hypothetical protein C4B60_17055 [Jeotgalibacillus proteolyticus]